MGSGWNEYRIDWVKRHGKNYHRQTFGCATGLALRGPGSGNRTRTAFTGLSYGALFSLFPAATADYYGVKKLGVNYGLVFTAWGLAGIIGPLMAGWVVDTTRSYDLSYKVCALLLVFAAGLSFFTSHPSQVRNTVLAVAK